MEIHSVQKVHFIGIGGIGMSALARHFLHEKKVVSGSDRAQSPLTLALESEGVRFFPSQVAGNIADDIDLVVYTEAMPRDHEELVAARTKGIRTINYFEALGLVANQYDLIAVAGSHGKTTTTAMLIDIFEDAGLDPSAVVGSLRARTGKNYRAGKGKYFIAEACEYRRDFLHLEPKILVITNIEAEHLDYYKDLDDVIAAFRELAMKVPEDGAIICNAKDPAVMRATEGARAKIVDYTQSIDLLMPMRLPGMHNRMNAAAAIDASREAGIAEAQAKATLQAFEGTWRRFEYKGKTPLGALVYDDYAHHPSEIRATIAGARERYPDKIITVVFQPHLYSRTKLLFSDFAEELGKAGDIVLLPIYAAREPNDPSISSELLAEEIAKQHPEMDVKVFKNFDLAARWLRMMPKEESVIVTMGASDLYKLADILISSTWEFSE